MDTVYVIFQNVKHRNEWEIELQKWIPNEIKRILKIKTINIKQYFDMKYVWYQNQSFMREISLEIVL